MKEIVQVGEQIMFMRTVDLMVCNSAQRIHGIRISLNHDPKKDPDHNEYLDNFYSGHMYQKNLDKTYYTGMLGEQEGDCQYIYIDEGERIEAVVIHHDDQLIRVMEFRMSSNRIEKAGSWTGQIDDLEHEIINFTHGEEIVGLFGKIETQEETNTQGKTSVKKNFVSLGFILNQCETMRLTEFSAEITRKKAQSQQSQ